MSGVRKSKSISASIVIIIVGFIVMLFAYFTLLRGQIKEKQKLSQTIKMQDKLNDLYQREVKALGHLGLSKGIRTAKDNPAILKINVAQMLGQVSRLAKKSQVSLELFELGNQEKIQSFFLKTPIQIVSTGKYIDLMSFFASINQLPHLKRFSKMNLKVQNNRFDANQRLEAEFNLEIYTMLSSSRQMKVQIDGVEK